MEPSSRQLNENYANNRVSMQYPYILIHGSGDSLPVALEALKPGSVPLLINYKNTTYNVGTISPSARELKKLLSVFPFTIFKSAEETFKITTSIDILEAGVWMV